MGLPSVALRAGGPQTGIFQNHPPSARYEVSSAATTALTVAADHANGFFGHEYLGRRHSHKRLGIIETVIARHNPHQGRIAFFRFLAISLKGVFHFNSASDSNAAAASRTIKVMVLRFVTTRTAVKLLD
jgi:hypothetical protein